MRFAQRVLVEMPQPTALGRMAKNFSLARTLHGLPAGCTIWRAMDRTGWELDMPVMSGQQVATNSGYVEALVGRLAKDKLGSSAFGKP